MNKVALVTGGAGFLGNYLCNHLLETGYSVICLDNFFTGVKSNIEHLLNNKKFQCIHHNIIEPFDFKVDEIFNFACPASPSHYQIDPIFTIKTSFLGTLNVLELAKKYNAKVFQASTSEVYGDPEIHPQTEDYKGCVNPIGLRACYDEGKRSAETLCFDYKRTFNTDIKLVRIFNTYGPKMHPKDGRVISNFIIQALMGENITIYGDGTQTRSFCYVDDLINGVFKMMNSNLGVHGPINLGNSSEFKISELAQIIKDLTNSKSRIIFKELPKDDPKQRRPDISLARKELNWEPKINLKEGLEKTIMYFDNLIHKK